VHVKVEEEFAVYTGMLPSAHLQVLNVPDAAGEVEDSGHATQAV
jgi:hypothetical protein